MNIRQGTGSALEPEDMRSILEPIYRRNLSYWAYVFPLIELPLPIARVWFQIVLFSRKLGVLLQVILDLIISRNNLVMTSQVGSKVSQPG
jgi:hypothetical protein